MEKSTKKKKKNPHTFWVISRPRKHHQFNGRIFQYVKGKTNSQRVEIPDTYKSLIQIKTSKSTKYLPYLEAFKIILQLLHLPKTKKPKISFKFAAKSAQRVPF